ncbi:MAG: DUF2073 domain-containing protein [Candidatus Woesearchaeota archaeon]
MKDIVLQYVPYNEISSLSEEQRIEYLLNIAKDDKIALLEGRLKKVEEAALIRKTMEQINRKFKGIELATINPSNVGDSFGAKIRKHLASMLLGDSHGMTIIGPATIVREIKQDPNKIQLYTVKK